MGAGFITFEDIKDNQDIFQNIDSGIGSFSYGSGQTLPSERENYQTIYATKLISHDSTTEDIYCKISISFKGQILDLSVNGQTILEDSTVDPEKSKSFETS